MYLDGLQDLGELYHKYRPFLYKLSKRYIGRGLEHEDILQAAFIGLYNASNGYRADLGVKFITYLYTCVSHAIQRELAGAGKIINLPEWLYPQLTKYKTADRELCQTLSRRPTRRELAVKLGFSVKKITELEKILYQTSIESLDKPIGEDDNLTLSDTVSDNSHDEMISSLELGGLESVLWRLAGESLDPEQYEILYKYFKLNFTYSAIAAERGLTLQTVTQRKITHYAH